MISVIIPARNATQTLEECLSSVLNQEGFQLNKDYEVILVDDGSSDDTALIGIRNGVKVVQQKHAGPAAARNAGAMVANGSLLVFTDADCAPSTSWLIELTRPFANEEVVGVKGAYLTHQTGLVPRFVQLEYEYKYVRMRRQVVIDFIDTFSAAYRREIFIQNGGFDESFSEPSAEDAEFSFRLARKGYHMVFEPNAKVFHYHDHNFSDYLHRKFGIGYWKAFMLRWTPEKIFSDSHAAPIQRVEIIILGIILLILPFIILWPTAASLAFIAAVLLFLIVTIPFQFFIRGRDRQVLWISTIMLIARAGALGMGLLKGFLLPPEAEDKGLACQSMSTRAIKRFMDIIGACLGLIMSLPIMACAALAIRLDSHGPVIFRQSRVGEYGKLFTLYKLRTMVDGADQKVTDLLPLNSLKGPAFKIPNDPRVTKVGRYLRRWSLDELPQFWNVFKGDMSLVGPRPEIPHFVDRYNDDQRQRLTVKPGLTGPVQVNGRGGLDFDQRFQMEMDYLRNYSLLMDMKIVVKTFAAIISGEGIG